MTPVLRYQGIAVVHYGFSLSALALKPSSFGSIGDRFLNLDGFHYLSADSVFVVALLLRGGTQNEAVALLYANACHGFSVRINKVGFVTRVFTFAGAIGFRGWAGQSSGN